MVISGNLRPGVPVRITRRHTVTGISPYKGVIFRHFSFPDRAEPVFFPENWPDESRRTIAAHCLVRDGITADLAAVPDDAVPTWLWLHKSNAPPAEEAPESCRTRGESDVRQLFDRMAGAWTYHGWQGGYFDTEEDARAFFDEMRWLLLHRRISPPLEQWRTMGLYWAYGLRTDEDGSFVTDYRTGGARRAQAGDIPPHGETINSTHGALSGEGGVWDLWEREGRILAQRGQCGVNVSEIVAPRHGPSLMDMLKLGDSAATLSGARPPEQKRTGEGLRRITIDSIHPEAEIAANQPLAQMGKADAATVGTAISHRHIQGIIDAVQEVRPSKRQDNAALRFAIQSARQAGLPERLIQRTLARLELGRKITAQDVLGTQPNCDADTSDRVSDTVTVFRIDDDAMAAALTGKDEPASLIDAVARNAWLGIPGGIQFNTQANAWNTCPETGPIRTASGDGSYLFLDDTAAGAALVNAPAFLDDDGSINIEALCHASSLLTIAADIALMVTAHLTPRLARRCWDLRPLSMSLSGVASVIMAQGHAFDSDEGRALCQALCSLLTGTGYLTSAQMADELGRFPAYSANADAMHGVIDRHSLILENQVYSQNYKPLWDKLNVIWQQIRTCGEFRNAQVTLITPLDEDAKVLACDSLGIQPLPAVVRYERGPHATYSKTINPSVRWALYALGYAEAHIDDVVRHVIGRGTLAGAPGVNHETLKKRGFTEVALMSVEAALATASDIGQVFNTAVLGEHYCVHFLGFTPEELQDDDFDVLTALGFSDAGIEAANIYCCGAHTLEGAPHLQPEHLAVFDCARTQGDRGSRQVSSDGILRMMAAAQPAISGGIGHVLTLPTTATLEDCRAAIMLGWQYGLKALTLYRQSDEATAISGGVRDDVALTVVESAPPQIVPQVKREARAETGPATALEPNSEIAVTDHKDKPAGDAETPRRATSLPTRGTASVTSSADAVVEQRQV